MSYLYFCDDWSEPVGSDVDETIIEQITPKYLYLKTEAAGEYKIEIYTSAIDHITLFSSLQEAHTKTVEEENTGVEIELNQDWQNGEKYVIRVEKYEENLVVKVEEFSVHIQLTTISSNNLLIVASNLDKGAIELELRLIPDCLDYDLDDNTEVVINVQRKNADDANAVFTSIFETTKIINMAHSNIVKLYDYSAISGMKYQYQINLEVVDEVSTLLTSDEIVALDLEDIFLGAQGQMIKIKFNPTVSGFKRNIKETFVETLGARYPFVRRNGNVNYHSFTLGGLLSYESDDLNAGNTIEDNYAREREYRNAVMEFLYKNSVKLYKSAQEGNLLVVLSNISFTPEQKLGRLVYSFSCTVTEVKEATTENINKIMEGV